MIKDGYESYVRIGDWTSGGLLLSKIRQGSRVLEFGPAQGHMTAVMKNELDCKITAIEIEPEYCNKVMPYVTKLINCDIESFEWLTILRNEHFDYIVFADVLEHLRNPTIVVEKAMELLTLDGVVLISVPNIGHSSVMIDLFNNKFRYRTTGLLDNTHISFFTYERLIQLLASVGLEYSLLTATYVEPEKTEFENSYNDVPKEVSNFLQQRPFAEVYQFIVVAHRRNSIQNVEKVTNLKKSASWINISSLYFDSTDGNRVIEKEIMEPVIGEIYELDFPLLSTFGEYNKIIIEPLNKECIMEIVDITVYSDGIRKSLASFEVLTDLKIKNYYIFFDRKPRIIVDVPNINRVILSIRYIYTEKIDRSLKEILKAYNDEVIALENLVVKLRDTDPSNSNI